MPGPMFSLSEAVGEKRKINIRMGKALGTTFAQGQMGIARLPNEYGF